MTAEEENYADLIERTQSPYRTGIAVEEVKRGLRIISERKYCRGHIPTDPVYRPILDIGSQDGYQTALINKEIGECIGVDLSRTLTHMCHERGVQVVRCDAQHLPFRGDSFGVVYSRRCLEHLRDEREGFRDWCRVLREGGVMVFIVPRFGNPSAFYDKTTGRVTRLDVQEASHFHTYDLPHIVSLLRGNALYLKKIEVISELLWNVEFLVVAVKSESNFVGEWHPWMKDPLLEAVGRFEGLID